MIFDLIFRPSCWKILKKMVLEHPSEPFTANELAREIGVSTPVVLKSLEELVSIGIIKIVKMRGKIREYYEFVETHPLRPIIEDLIETGKQYDKYIRDTILEHIDRIAREHYYIGMYWAAFSDYTPIDYTPTIFAVYTRKQHRLLALSLIEKVYCELWSSWKPNIDNDIFIMIIPQKKFPPVKRGNIMEKNVRVTLIEVGIAQCFSKENRCYPPYASALALIQNIADGRAKEHLIEKYAKETETLNIIKAIASYANHILEKNIFKQLAKNTQILQKKPRGKIEKWGTKPTIPIKANKKIILIDPKPIEAAITTVYG
ncbi:MAG: HTH domain-containing protein [Candidatus Njordarchaeota archaeon]